MKKSIVLVGVLALVIIGAAAFFGGSALRKSGGSVDDLAAIPVSDAGQSATGQPVSEQAGGSDLTRAPEIRGTVKAIEGDKVIIARAKDDPLANMTEEQFAARRREMMKLSMEERQARRQQELQGLETENVNITVPVGTPVVKMTGGQSQAGEGGSASLADIRVGMSLVIWTQDGKIDNAIAEHVNIAAVQQ